MSTITTGLKAGEGFMGRISGRNHARNLGALSPALLIALSLASTLRAQTPALSKEYIRLGGRIIAIENDLSVTDGKGAADVSGSTSCCIVAAADFNGDGTPDLVWQNPPTGAASIWLMGGANGTMPRAS
jgi:hypothetical protein